VQASEQSVYWSRVSCESEPDVDNRLLLLTSLNTHSKSLSAADQLDAAISAAQEALVLCRALLPETFQLASTGSDWAILHRDYHYQAAECSHTFCCLARVYAAVDRHHEAYMTLKEGLEVIALFSGSIPPPSGSDIDAFFNYIVNPARFTLSITSLTYASLTLSLAILS
jgi:hypothetical protein